MTTELPPELIEVIQDFSKRTGRKFVIDPRTRANAVLVGLGKFGHEVVDRVLHSLDGGSPLLGVLRCEAGGVAAGLQPLLEELLRAGRGDGERRDPRLDVFLFAGALQGGEGDLLNACEQAARLVAEGYGAIFPADRPPEPLPPRHGMA